MERFIFSRIEGEVNGQSAHPRYFCEGRIEAVEVENVGAEVAGDGRDAAAALGAVGADLEEHTYVTSAMDGGGEEGPPKGNEVREVA